MKRRLFLKKSASVTAIVMTSDSLLVAKEFKWKADFRYLRPPGALEESEFVDRCIRCNKCSEACPNDCIKFFGMENGFSSWGTPYIIPREQACILCMKCGDACPTGAITVIEDELSTLLAKVKMGKAEVDEEHCLSYQGKTCGVCYRACPFPDIAMTIGYLEQPTVTTACVGCGLCERSCIQLPQAVRIIPSYTGSG
jgi:MauM/NapG family ferredoxin protein